MRIRRSVESDRAAISHVHARAFGPAQGQEIVDLVNELLNDATAGPMLSLVAETDGKLVGHILFTAATLQSNRNISARILAPLSVSPDFQCAGIGGELIKEGLQLLTASAVDLVFVLGHPGYYPRFGFQPACALGYETPYPLSPEQQDAWMVQELQAGVIGTSKGTIQCCEALDQPRHWQE